jgi:hypothetical protein
MSFSCSSVNWLGGRYERALSAEGKLKNANEEGRSCVALGEFCAANRVLALKLGGNTLGCVPAPIFTLRELRYLSLNGMYSRCFN